MANSSAMDLTRDRPIRQILLFSMPLVAGGHCSSSCIPLWIQ